MNNIMVINGGMRLHGELKVQGEKNYVLPILAAAVIIGGEAYRSAFIRAGGFRFQWQRFNAMLTYVQERYFGAKSVDANALLPEFNAALTKCVSEFIDTRCIVAY